MLQMQMQTTRAHLHQLQFLTHQSYRQFNRVWGSSTPASTSVNQIIVQKNQKSVIPTEIEKTIEKPIPQKNLEHLNRKIYRFVYVLFSQTMNNLFLFRETS